MFYFSFPLLDSPFFSERPGANQSNLHWVAHSVPLSIYQMLPWLPRDNWCYTKEKAAAAWDWLPAPSAVGFGTRRGCLKNNWFQFYFVCAVSFLNSLCCDKVGNSRSHQAFSGTFRTQGKAHTSVKTLFQNLFIQLLFSNIQYSL